VSDGGLDARLGEVSGRTRATLERLQRDVPTTIYHYTSGTALRGIVDSRRIWAGHLESFGDSGEILYAFGLVRHVLDQEAARHRTGAQAELANRLRAALAPFSPYLEAYAACFCEEGDLLTAWRAYGREGGVAIGLDTSFLERRARTTPGYSLVRVIYDRAAQEELVRSTIAGALGALGEGEAREDAVSRCEGFVLAELTPAFASCKHPSLAEEREWRLVHAWAPGEAGLPVQFRRGSNGLTSYVELKVTDPAGIFDDRIPIHRFVAGPTANPRQAAKTLALFRYEHGYEGSAEIVRSAIPHGA